MAVLLLFNNIESNFLSFDYISNILKLKEIDLKKILLVYFFIII